MNQPSFDTHIETAIFSELLGFVAADPATLDRFHGGSAAGLDLLTLYTTTDVGDRVAATGAAIPILGVDAGHYAFAVRDAVAPSVLAQPARATSSGWILQVTSGEVALCGVGHLKCWQPQAVRRVAVPNGWYRVDIHLGNGFDPGVNEGLADDDFAIELVMSPCTTMPEFSADVSQALVLDETTG